MSQITDDQVQAFIDALTAIVRDDRDTNPTRIEIESGQKYIRVIAAHGPLDQSHRSAYGFIEKSTGNLYKPASWKGPIKNVIRGNIQDGTWRPWCGKYGIASAK